MIVQFTARKFMGMVTLKGREWSEEFPVERLASRNAFYERMAAKYGHKSPSYASALAALKSLT